MKLHKRRIFDIINFIICLVVGFSIPASDGWQIMISILLATWVEFYARKIRNLAMDEFADRVNTEIEKHFKNKPNDTRPTSTQTSN